MKNIFKLSITVVLILVFIFIIATFSGKYILPTFYGESNIDKKPISINLTNILLDQKMPFFDLPNTTSGRVKSTQFIDSPVVLIFWATWNKDSIDQLKILDDYILNNEKQKSLVSFVMINSQEDESIVKSFIRRSAYDMNFVLDKYGDVSESFNIKSLPTIYFIDKDGIVRDIYNGILNQTGLTDKIENILK